MAPAIHIFNQQKDAYTTKKPIYNSSVTLHLPVCNNGISIIAVFSTSNDPLDIKDFMTGIIINH